jgi:hypothetical protein
MSDAGLYGTVYEQLRTYADQLDQALIALRNPATDVARQARLDLAGLLRALADRTSTNPATRFVAVILRQELPVMAGQGLTLCESLASALEHHTPTPAELSHLEQIAIALDRECATSLARINGRS